MGAAVTASYVPVLIAGLLAVCIALARATWSLSVWQKLTVVALLGYMVLNYGFANLAFTFGGIPVPVGHVLTLSALTLALPGKGAEVRLFLHEPLVRAWLVLLALTLLHLLGDAPTHGLYGIRDASFVVEGLFLLLGFLCATGERRPPDAAEAHGSAAWPEFSVCVYPPTGRITAGCVAGLGGFSPGSTAGFLSPDVPISREWRRPARSGRQGHARMAVVATTAQPWLEFSYGTIPFYILLGYGVGLAGHVDAVADRAEASLRP